MVEMRNKEKLLLLKLKNMLIRIQGILINEVQKVRQVITLIAQVASAAAKAGGEPDPTRDPAKGRGVERIQQNTTKIDMQDAQPSNFISLNKVTHVGIITKVIKDEDGNVIGFKFQDSGGDPSKGKSGPRNSTAMIGNDYWGKRIQGVYKWDTKPDTNQGDNNVKQGGSSQLPMLLKPYASSQSFEQTVNKFLNGVIR